MRKNETSNTTVSNNLAFSFFVFVTSSCSVDGIKLGVVPDNVYSNAVYSEPLSVLVNSDLVFSSDDVSVVIKDPSIIDIYVNVTEHSTYGPSIRYRIKGLSPGTTSFHFEIPSLNLKTEQAEITVTQNIKSLSFKYTHDITILGVNNSANCEFIATTFDDLSHEHELLFVSENPQIATIKYDDDSFLSDKCIIESVGVGETYIYIQSKDGSIQSKKIKVIVCDEKSHSNNEPDISVEEDSSRIVYITPYGRKYHYSQACAGKNASAISEDKANKTHSPCKKCVHN